MQFDWISQCNSWIVRYAVGKGQRTAESRKIRRNEGARHRVSKSKNCRKIYDSTSLATSTPNPL